MDDPGALNPTKEAPRERTGVHARAVTTAPLAGQSVTAWLVVVLVVVLFSGGLFGYDQGVISGALARHQATFSLSALLVEVVTSWVTLGALVGLARRGELADQIGRKRTVLFAGALFTLGALVQASGPRRGRPGLRATSSSASGSGWLPSSRRSMLPNWRRRMCGVASSRAYQLAITWASSSPTWSMAGCPKATGGRCSASPAFLGWRCSWSR